MTFPFILSMPPVALTLSISEEWAIGIVSLSHILIFLSVALHCLIRPRDPRSTLSWLFLTGSFPFVGGLLYAMIAVNRVSTKAWHKTHSDDSFLTLRRSREEESQPLAYWRSIQGNTPSLTDPAAATLNRMLNVIAPWHPLLDGNKLACRVDGEEAYPSIFEAIRNAQHHIHLQVYILRPDKVGRELMERLAERARGGVMVRLLYDRFGSSSAHLFGFFNRWRAIPNMQIAGFTQANLLRRQIQMNLRNHRKLLVVDGRVGFAGGMNFHVENLASPTRPAIRDYHFDIRGPLVSELQHTFLRDWYYITDENPDTLLSPDYFPMPERPGNTPARILNGGPTSERETLIDGYFAAIAAARQQVLIVTPYFVPPPDLLRVLRAAAQRGVEVKILLSQACNHISVTYASRTFYESLMAAGVRIFERRPPFIHAKAMIVDDALAIIGSANLDERSLRLSYETNVVVMDSVFATDLKRIVLADFAAADERLLDAWRNRPGYTRMIENLFALMSPVL